MVSGGVLKGTSAKAALKKLQQRTMVVVKRLNWTKGLMDYAKHRYIASLLSANTYVCYVILINLSVLSSRNEASKSSGNCASTSSDRSSSPQPLPPSESAVVRPEVLVKPQRACPLSRKRSASKDDDAAEAKRRRLSTTTESQSTGSETGEVDVIEVPSLRAEKPTEIVNIVSPDPRTTNSNRKEKDMTLRDLLEKPKTVPSLSRQPSEPVKNQSVTVAKPCSNVTSMPSEPVKNQSVSASNPYSNTFSVPVSNSAPLQNARNRVLSIAPSNNILPASHRIIEAALRDISNAICDAETELAKLNDLLATFERLPPQQRSAQNMAALLESHMLLSLKSGLVKQCVDRGIVKQLGRSFYPELLTVVQKNEKLKIYSSMRLMTMVNMLLTISQSTNDPKQVLSAFVAKAYHEQGQRLDKSNKGNSENNVTTPQQAAKPAQAPKVPSPPRQVLSKELGKQYPAPNKSRDHVQEQSSRPEIQLQQQAAFNVHISQAQPVANNTFMVASQSNRGTNYYYSQQQQSGSSAVTRGPAQTAVTASAPPVSSQSSYQAVQSSRPPPYPVAMVSRRHPTSSQNVTTLQLTQSAQNSAYIQSSASSSSAPAQNVQVRHVYRSAAQHAQRTVPSVGQTLVPVSNSGAVLVSTQAAQSQYVHMAAMQSQVQQRPIQAQQHQVMQVQNQPQQVLQSQPQQQGYMYRDQQQQILLVPAAYQQHQQHQMVQINQPPAVVMQSQVVQTQQTQVIPSVAPNMAMHQLNVNHFQSQGLQSQGSHYSGQNQASQLSRPAQLSSNHQVVQYAQPSQQQLLARQLQGQQFSQQYGFQQSQNQVPNATIPFQYVNQNGGNQQMGFRPSVSEQPQTDIATQARVAYDHSRENVKVVSIRKF